MAEVQEELISYFLLAANQGGVSHGPAFFVSYWLCNISCQTRNFLEKSIDYRYDLHNEMWFWWGASPQAGGSK
jgi:hypothetical protein